MARHDHHADHRHHHGHGHHHAHDHEHYHDHDHAPHGPGHNLPHGASGAAQWQTPHRPEGPSGTPAVEPDLDKVEKAFVDGFLAATDPTSFLRLARVPFEISVNGASLRLLRVEIDALTDVGSLTPHLGGGIVSEPLTFDLILKSFYTIWLKAEPEEHMARVRKQGDLRPMADDRSAMAELRNILLSREPLYARASAVVDTAGLSVDDAAARLIEAVTPVLENESRSFGARSAAL